MSGSTRKRVLLVLAGAADAPRDGTPLSDAEAPGLDEMARRGRAGTMDVAASTPWSGFTALLGLREDEAALGPVEALGAGVEVPPGAAAWRADFVTMDDRGLRDPTGGRVREPEAGILLQAARSALPGVALHRLEGHRNLAVAPLAADGAAPEFAPSPWEMVGRRPVAGLGPTGRLREWFDAAAAALGAHDVNQVRVDLLENPANALWFHGGGVAVAAGLRAAYPAVRPVLVGRGRVTGGLARALAWEAAVADGDDEALAAEAMSRLRDSDLVVVRTESVLWASAAGGPLARRDAISAADARLVRPLLHALEESGEFGFAVASDATIDSRSGALLRGAAPLAVLTDRDAGAGSERFTESACLRSGFHLRSAVDLADALG